MYSGISGYSGQTPFRLSPPPCFPHLLADSTKIMGKHTFPRLVFVSFVNKVREKSRISADWQKITFFWRGGTEIQSSRIQIYKNGHWEGWNSIVAHPRTRCWLKIGKNWHREVWNSIVVYPWIRCWLKIGKNGHWEGWNSIVAYPRTRWWLKIGGNSHWQGWISTRSQELFRDGKQSTNMDIERKYFL